MPLHTKSFLPVIILLFLLGGTAIAAEIIYEDKVFPEPVTFDDNFEFWAELDEDGNVYMDWSKYNHSEAFEFYKVVRSDSNPNPVYPQDGYIFFTDNADVLTFTETDVPFGEHYYRVCAVAGPKRYCSSETQKIIKKAPIFLEKNLQFEKIAIDPDMLAVTEDDNPADTPEIMPEEEAEGQENADEESLPEDNAPVIERPILRERPEIENVKPESANGSIESFISEYWVQFLALLVSLIGVSLAVTGFTLAGAKKKKSVSRLINEIDDTFASFKWKTKRCEAELYRLQDVVEDELKTGKLDEGAYQLLLKRIDKYLSEIQDIDNLPEHLKDKQEP